MSNNAKPLATHKGVSTLVRPKFGPGMLLEHGDLELLPAYTRDLSRMMFRALFGCGVVCGLHVDAVDRCGKVRITVACGLAIDCEGDPVYVPEKQDVDVDFECEGKNSNELFVVLCGTTKCCAPRASMCAADDDDGPPACTRERDAFEIRVLEKSTGCGCIEKYESKHSSDCKCVDPAHPCYIAHYDGLCGCADNLDDKNCECHCECILLAKVVRKRSDAPWAVDHSVRRFVRPVLMRDREVEKDREKKKEEEQQQAQVAAARVAKAPAKKVARTSQAPGGSLPGA
jgi:hypothetical protein